MKKQQDTIYSETLKELWKIRNPHLEFNDISSMQLEKTIDEQVGKEKKERNFNLPSRKAYFELSTARNRNLINIDEQNLLRKTVVAFFGLSVGSHAALTWMMLSRADAIKIVDPDAISASNLNRLRMGWKDIGKKKTAVVEEELSKINPFATIYSFSNGSPQEVRRVIESSPSADIIIDEIDNFEVKIVLRKIAKERKIPLISAADVGDNVVLDIERYDETPQPEMFLGRVAGMENINFSKLTDKEKKKLIIKLVGFEENSEKMLNSLFAIGGSIVTWPQLGSTASIAGGVVATAIKKIILGEKVKSGRYYFSLDDILVDDFNSAKRKSNRDRLINQIQKVLKR